ncbi:MAG: hypothetical protein ACHBN1_23290 [Heteroscytonema crispum UTEX LB 1556]
MGTSPYTTCSSPVQANAVIKSVFDIFGKGVLAPAQGPKLPKFSYYLLFSQQMAEAFLNNLFFLPHFPSKKRAILAYAALHCCVFNTYPDRGQSDILRLKGTIRALRTESVSLYLGGF